MTRNTGERSNNQGAQGMIVNSGAPWHLRLSGLRSAAPPVGVSGAPEGGGPFSCRLRCASVTGINLLPHRALPTGKLPRRTALHNLQTCPSRC